MPNNRQWALIVWGSLVFLWFLVRKDGRRTLAGLLRTMASAKLIASLVVLAGFVVGLAALASQVGLWDSDRVTDTAFWFVTVGLVMFVNSTKVSTDRHFLRRKAVATLEISSLVEVLSEVFVLNL